MKLLNARQYERQLRQFLMELNEERLDKGIKVSRISEVTGIDYTVVTRMLKGEIKHPSFVKVVLIAEFFERNIGEVCGRMSGEKQT